jgi:hypothetical protein
MKKFLLITLITIASLFTVAAKAQAGTGVVVAYIHEDFVAGGKTLPAGTYKVYQGSPETGQMLILSGEKGGAIFLIPSMHNQAVTGQFKVNLKRAGNVYYLSEVATDLGVYSLPAPRTLAGAAKAKDRTSAAFGAN